MAVGPDVVITGIGVVSPIGIGSADFWNSLCQARSGVSTVPYLASSAFPVSYGAWVPHFDGKQYVQPRKAIKLMCREIQFGFAASMLALQQASIANGSIAPERLGVVFGSEMYYGELPEMEPTYRACMVDGQFQFDKWGDEGMRALNPLWMLKYLPNMVACHVAIACDARGPNNTITLGEASSMLAFSEGVHVIRRGHADVVLVGGSGNRLNITPLMYRQDARLTHFQGDPAAASRPFDADRAGMVNGEGAATLVLESREHAEKRGAKILARVAGVTCTYETPDDDGDSSGTAMERALASTLAQAQIEASQVGFVKANGVATVKGDAREARAIRAVLGDVPVTAPKSLFGNLGAASGIVEAAAAALAVAERKIFPTRNYERPDPACPVNVVRGQTESMMSPYGMILSASGTGQTVSMLLESPN